MATTSNQISFYAYKEPTITAELTMIDNGPRTAESTIEQQECEITEEINETFYFIDYAKLVTTEMLEQLENNKNKELSLDNIDSLVITNPRHPKFEIGQIYKDKATLKSFLSYFAITNHFQYKVFKSCSREYSIICLEKNCKFSDQQQATSKLIGNYIKPKFLNLKTTCTPLDIKGDLNDRYSIKMNYRKAWRSKEHALNKLRGNAKESYNLIPSYLYMLQKTNPGTIVDIEKGEDKSLLFLFMALNASLRGWEKCKPIIVVDGTFLKSAYGGTLLSASAQDARGKIFPLAFYMEDSENNKSWEWFFTKLRAAYGVREDQCIISDRHESIIKATNKVFPKITHGYCMFHLLRNLKTTYKKHAKEYSKIGYHKWSRFYSKNKRYSVMTSNIAESLNAATVAAREVPVTILLECLHGLLQDWTYTNRKLDQKTMTRLTPVAKQALTNNFVYSLRLTVKPANEYLFEVFKEDKSWIVNLKERICT
ncbi:uncharacterized protein LOC133791748 [Humulus lupulus]|uniref:uncharacterized protein LOC133791748 n=1 Tax=Humulus lupulus TaxID=3486 RepID=UPI002B40C1FF|nr:uncharacterized protein LOC133791748 [Humulus lupulus]